MYVITLHNQLIWTLQLSYYSGCHVIYVFIIILIVTFVFILTLIMNRGIIPWYLVYFLSSFLQALFNSTMILYP